MSEELYSLFDDEYLEHYGTPRHSGRYPWGSGEDPFQHEKFYQSVKQLKSEGLTDKEIAGVFDMSFREYRAMSVLSSAEKKYNEALKKDPNVSFGDFLKEEWGGEFDPSSTEKLYKDIQRMRSEGKSEKEIWTELKMTSSDYRALNSLASNEHKAAEARIANELASYVDENGKRLYSNVDIGKMLGRPDTTIGNYLKEGYSEKTLKTQDTIDNLKAQFKDIPYLDVGAGSEYLIGCSDQRLANAVKILNKTEGYELYDVNVRQIGTGLMTKVKVLAPPGTTYSDVLENKDQIKPPSGGVELYPPDANTLTLNKYSLNDPVSISSKRCMVRYAEDGGLERDGLIEIRPGVDDISLGNASYLQARIAVDGTHYIKGMAVYADDLPDGVDIRFNTNKHVGTPMVGEGKDTVFKAMKDDDDDNPFGATIRQFKYVDSKTGEEKQSAINIVNEEGDWGGDEGWSRKISAQMLAKQNYKLVERQLNLTYADKVSEFDDIMSVNNPVVKKKLLEAFADECDASAVHLKASPFPRQSWNVILPVESLSPDEVYAPQYKNGETVVLVRFPHGGTFEIPQLKVNNTNKEAERMIKQGIDAVGINAKVAEKLSGADFDGDTVLVIPCNSSSSNVRIKTSPSLEGLKDFDPKERYKYHEGMKVMPETIKGREMGIVTNLITDMTIKGADENELAAAVRHSMVVIDAVKHKLDYQQSYEDNHIEELKQKYQKHSDDDGYGGSSTLLSRAKGATYVLERKEGKEVIDPVTGKKKRMYIDPDTGEKLYTETGALKKELVTQKVKVLDDDGNPVRDSSGKIVYEKVPVLNEKGKKVYVQTDEPVKQISTQMAETKDARTLASGYSVIEDLYAGYANKMKGLANEARKAYLATPNLKYDPKANKEYSKEVESLGSKLLISLKNAPRERQAQILANAVWSEKIAKNPKMDKDDQKKIKSQILKGARDKVGAKKTIIGSKAMPITEREWAAVNSGAITNSKCQQIVDNADLDVLRKLSMPKRSSLSLSSAKVSQIHAMINSGFTLSEIADKLNVTTATVSKYSKN